MSRGVKRAAGTRTAATRTAAKHTGPQAATWSASTRRTAPMAPAPVPPDAGAAVFPAEPAPHVGYLLSEAAKCVRDATAAALAPFGLAPREFGALDTLALAGPMTQRVLGDRRRIDRTTIVALVDHLERLGLVARTPNPQDRRAHALRVTAEGRRVVARAREAAQGVEAAFLAPVGPVDREALRRALTTALRSAAPVRPD